MDNLNQLLTDCIGKKQDRYLLNQSQIGLYFFCKEHPESLAYNLPSACMFPKGNVDLARLCQAIRKALNNHVALRCKIVEQDGLPYWVDTNKQYDDMEIPVIKISDAALCERKNDYAKPFDVKSDCLFRVEICETETSYCILSDFHHLIYDGSSCRVWFQEINQAYLGQPLEPEQVTMLDYCAFDEMYAKTDNFAVAGQYYKTLFGDTCPRMTIPADLSADDTPGDGNMVYEMNRKITHTRVNTLTEGKVGAFFIGAFAYAVARFVGKKESIVYTGNHGRFDARMKNSVGMFVRMLPIYITENAQASVYDYLDQATDRIYGAIKKGNYGIGRLMQEYGLSIDLSVLYQGDFFSYVQFDGMDCPWEALPLHGVDDDVSIMIFKEGEHFRLKVEYRREKYKVETVRALLHTYEETIAEFLDRMMEERFCLREARIEEAGLLAEIEQICFPPHEACAPERVKERVELAPELFLVAEDRRTGKIAGFFNGVATDDASFRDDFFLDIGLHKTSGKHVMLLGLDVLPEYRGIGLARVIVNRYVQREQANNRKSLILTCLDEKVSMYEKMGFVDHGYADSTWGNEQWHEMEIML